MGLVDKITGREGTLQKLLDLKAQAKKGRYPFDGEAWLDRAFFLNQQWTEWNDASQSIREIPRAPEDQDLPRPVFNKIQSYVLTAQAESLQDKPSIDVLPGSDDYQAQIDQDVSKAYLEWWMEPTTANWDRQLSRGVLQALTSPGSWLKWFWDDTLKRPDVVPVPFEDMYVDPFALNSTFDRARYVIHSQLMDPNLVEDIYGVKVEPDDISHADAFKMSLMRGMGSVTTANGIIVNELWQKPSKRHQRGVYAVFSGRKLLDIEDKLPYQHLYENGGRLPFTMLGSLERPDSMYYTSPVAGLRPAQMVWNKFIAQAILIFDAFANPKWWIDSRLQLEEDPNSSPRQILRGTSPDPGIKPEIIQPSTSPDVTRLLDVFEQQMMHVVAVHEVSQAQVPGRVEAAKAIELLQSADKGRYKHLLDTIDASISDGGYQVLALAREFEPDKKVIPIYTREGAALVKEWRAGAFSPATRVKVERMSGLGRTRAQREAKLENLWQQGIMQDPVAFAQLYGLPKDSFTDPNAQSTRLAQVENEEMGKGTAVNPNSWDNHAVHIREHNEYRTTLAYRSLSEDAKAKLEYHVNRHEQLQLIQLQKEAVKQLVASGQMPAPQQAGDTQPGAGSPSPAGGPPQPPTPAGPAGGGAGATGPPSDQNSNQATFYRGASIGPGADPRRP